MTTHIGTDDNDTLPGTSGNDTFIGGLGDDTFDGAAGADTAIRNEAQADLTFSIGADDSLVVSGGTDGTDTLYNVERVQTADGTLTVTTGMGQTRINTATGSDQQQPTITTLSGRAAPWASTWWRAPIMATQRSEPRREG